MHLPPILTGIQKFRRPENRVLPLTTIHQEPTPLSHDCKMQLSRKIRPLVLCSHSSCVCVFGNDRRRQLGHIRNLHCFDAISSQLALPTAILPPRNDNIKMYLTKMGC